MDDAPTPLEGTPLPDVDTEVSTTLPPPLPRRTRPPRPPSPGEKSGDVKTTLAQKLGLKAAFEKHGDALSDVQYSTQFGIPLKNTQRLLTQLRKGYSIPPRATSAERAESSRTNTS